ncbi:hypothetical protein ACP275_11G020300 [Erythranthe tilingii]
MKDETFVIFLGFSLFHARKFRERIHGINGSLTTRCQRGNPSPRDPAVAPLVFLGVVGSSTTAFVETVGDGSGRNGSAGEPDRGFGLEFDFWKKTRFSKTRGMNRVIRMFL